MIINLISSPRNISTAFMYSFANRGDLKVVDEPFYGYYLHKSDAEHPGKLEIIQAMPNSIEEVVEDIQHLHAQHETVFIKNMAHHLIDCDLRFLLDWTNVFLIRNPKQLIASFAEVIANPSHQDIGVARQHEIFEYLTDHSRKVLVVDSGELLANPEGVLTELCDRLGLPMTPNMLEWPAGAIPEDGIWAKYWYDNVHRSTGFVRQTTSDRPLPSRCELLYRETLPYYDALSKYSIKAT